MRAKCFVADHPRPGPLVKAATRLFLDTDLGGCGDRWFVRMFASEPAGRSRCRQVREAPQ